MAASTTREKFEAAVNVIHSLPKNGSFQPSHALMLQFYSFYKQATLGSCNIARPAFWDVVGKAKWDAWSKLGDMPQEEAMNKYVDQLKDIIEAMPHTDSVSDFVEKLGDFYVLVDDDDTPVPNGDLNPDGTPRKVGQLLRQHRLAQKGTGTPSRSDGESSTPPSSNNPSPARENGSESPEPPNDVQGNQPAGLASAEDENQLQYSIPVKQPMNNNSSKYEGAGHGVNGDSGLLDVSDRSIRPNRSPLKGRLNGFDDSDSEMEEYLDTSDRPQQIETEVLVHSEPADLHARASKRLEDDVPRHVSSAHVGDHTYTSLDRPDYNPDDAERWVPISRDIAAGNALTCRGGGDTPVEGRSSGGVRRSGSSASMSSQGHGGTEQRGLGSSGGGRSHQHSAGGSGGEGQDPHYPAHARGEVNEQIAVALSRLQHDMNSVLTRLHTLEALSVAQSRMRSRTPSENERDRPAQPAVWWWPFPQLSTRSVIFILAWPFFVHLMLRFLKRRANRRR